MRTPATLWAALVLLDVLAVVIAVQAYTDRINL